MPYISDAHRAAFVHIQKTGGTAIRHAILARMADCRREGAKHGTVRQLPALDDDFFIFTVVRNPYRRLASMYRFRRICDQKGGLFVRRFPTLSTLLEHMIARWRSGDGVFPVCQAEFIDGRVSVYRFERFGEVVDGIASQVGLDPTPPRRDAGVNYFGDYDWREELDRRAVEIINDECREDFRLFGYPMSTFEALRS